MKTRCLWLLFAGILVHPTMMVSCRKAEKVVVTKQRELTMFDDSRDSLVAVMPPEWRQIPGTSFRLFNYLFGEDGEVFLGRSRGGVLANANRWLGQFGQPHVKSIDGLPKLKVLGQEAVLVEATGKFAGGMGKPPREDAGLAGVIVAVGDQLLTVKMVGDSKAVAAERDRLIQFCENLRIRETKSDEQND